MKLPEWAYWLARDEDGELYAFEIKPFKSAEDGEWFEFECGRLKEVGETDDTFSHVKWEDEYPTTVDKDRNTFKWLEKPDLNLTRETLNEIFGSKPDEKPTEVISRLETPGVSAAELNRITSAKAHGYDSVPELVETPDTSNEPNHYKGKHDIETIDVIRTFGNDDMVAGFYWGNAIEYMIHYRNKNGLEDLKKARKNLDWLIEHMEGF